MEYLQKTLLILRRLEVSRAIFDFNWSLHDYGTENNDQY